MKKKIHVVPHSHWDREWYFTTSRSKVYLMKNLKDVLDTLEADERFHYFMLDAQGSLLDDYTKWMPQDKERIKRLVRANRLVIGPWYTQSDLMVISAESIVRNLYYGMKTCEEYGRYMNVGYVPDSFGQAGNMPQIYREFGIEDTLFWRGVSDDMVKHTDFMWKGHDGSRVFATQIPFGYYIGGNIPEDKKDRDLFWNKECLQKAGKGSTNQIYFPNGFDQAPIRKNLPDLIQQRNDEDEEHEYVISCIEDYMKDVKAQKPNLEEVEGELLIAKHMRIHKSIFSSRSDLKILNTKIQHYVTNIMEPLLTLSYALGNAYPKEAVKDVWKLLFENAAHDSIGSCISDCANEDVYMRYKQASDIAENLVELHERLLATSITRDHTGPITLTLFNTELHERKGVVTCSLYLPDGEFSILDQNGQALRYTILDKEDLSDYVLSQTIRLNPSKDMYLPKNVYRATVAIDTTRVPSFGYTQFSFCLESNRQEALQKAEILENEFYKIHIQADGSLNIKDKRNKIQYARQAILMENGDDGDSFNYSPPRNDLQVSSQNSNALYHIQSSSIYHKADIKYTMLVPKDLMEREAGICSIQMPVHMQIVLKKGSPVIEFEVTIDNKGIFSHRICAVFDTGIASAFHYADEQFGIIKRPNGYAKEMALYEAALQKKEDIQENGPLNWSNASNVWQEPPIAIEPTQNFVALCNDERGVALFPSGVREYEIIGTKKEQICLTLFRTYGFMGKENLLYRPGRASGEKIIATPNAQLQKTVSMKFAYYTLSNKFNKEHVLQLAHSYYTPIEVYEYADFLNGRLLFVQEDGIPTLPATSTIAHLEHGMLVISAIKKHEEKDGYIFRLYNPYDNRAVSDMLCMKKKIRTAYYVDLKENKKELPIRIEENKLYLEAIGHCKFISIYVEVV